MEKINFQDLPSTDTPIDSANLNALQDNVENAINEVNYKGGELIAYGIITSTASTTLTKDEPTAFAGFSSRISDIYNMNEEVLQYSSGAFSIVKPSIVSLIEVTTVISGSSSTATGVLFSGNFNELPSGVTVMNYRNGIAPFVIKYNSAIYTSYYNVNIDTDTQFFANPKFQAYGGDILSTAAGLYSYQIIKVYAKKRG